MRRVGLVQMHETQGLFEKGSFLERLAQASGDHKRLSKVLL